MQSQDDTNQLSSPIVCLGHLIDKEHLKEHSFIIYYDPNESPRTFYKVHAIDLQPEKLFLVVDPVIIRNPEVFFAKSDFFYTLWHVSQSEYDGFTKIVKAKDGPEPLNKFHWGNRSFLKPNSVFLLCCSTAIVLSPGLPIIIQFYKADYQTKACLKNQIQPYLTNHVCSSIIYSALYISALGLIIYSSKHGYIDKNLAKDYHNCNSWAVDRLKTIPSIDNNLEVRWFDRIGCKATSYITDISNPTLLNEAKRK